MQKITAIVPCYNEETNIERALRSLQWADEIIVVDSFSTDNTVAIAEKWAHRVVQHEYVNSATQKNWIIPQAAHEWIFLLDADEVVNDKLREEVQEVLTKGTNYSAFWIKRLNFFMDRPAKYSWSSDRVIRLFKKSENRYENKHVHAEIESQGEVSQLKEYLEHHTYKNFKNYFWKSLRYAVWSAHDKKDKVKKVTLFHLAVKPAFRFFRHYILKLGFLDGKVGFVIAYISAYYVFMRYLIIWRLKDGEKIEDKG